MRPAILCALACALALACGGDDLLLPGDSTATRIAIAGGDGQEGAVGATLAESISVLVSDATGRAVMGQAVAFVVTAGEGAALIPDTALTGEDGRAGARWVLGRNAGTQRAVAELVISDPDPAPSVVFSASASPGSAAVLARVSGDNQSAPAGSLLPDSLVVRAEDQFGNPVAGTSVNWTVSGGGSVIPTRVTTASDGRAAVRRLLGSRVGEQGAAAAVSGLSGSPVTFSHSATRPGDDDADDRIVGLSFLVQPSDAKEDERFSPPVQVAAVNAGGTPVASASGEAEVRLGRNPEGARLRGDRTRDLKDGVATFADLKVDKEGDGYTLIASAAGLSETESAPFRIVE